jgi:hypothetical protein
MSARPSAAELLRTPGALLTRSDLRELGLERRAVDAVFRKLPVIVLEGYSRPLFAVDEYVALLADSTYCARCPRCGLRAARAAGIGFARVRTGLCFNGALALRVERPAATVTAATAGLDHDLTRRSRS